MEDLKKARLQEEEEKFKAWINGLVTNALEQEEVEDYMYEYRWESYDEDTRRLRAGLYPLWAARVMKRSKEEMEALYQKGYRYIHKLKEKYAVIEVMDFNWRIVEEHTEEAMVVENIVIAIKEAIESDTFPPVLLNEYEQLEQHLKEKVRCELFVKMMDDYPVETKIGMKQEEFLQKMEQLFPVVYKDWMGVSVEELLFGIKEQVEICTKYIEKYKEFHKEDAERMQALEEYMSAREEENMAKQL